MVFRYSKSSKCQYTSFILVCSIEINFEYYCHLIVFVDVNILFISSIPYVPSDIQSVDQSITSITIPNYSCNNTDYTTFNFSRFSLIESIIICNNCFESVKTFKIDGLNRLKTIIIGNNSFTQEKNSWGNDKSKSFHILNCESLESIQIGQYSFRDFGGEFELKNLPQLQSIKIGNIGSESCNFYYSSLVIRGIELILNVVMI